MRTAECHRSLGRGRNGELLPGEVSDAPGTGHHRGHGPRRIPAPTPGPGQVTTSLDKQSLTLSPLCSQGVLY